MTTSTNRAALQQQRHELAEAVRAYTRAQLETWQRLPYLALQSWGQSGGFGQQAPSCFEDGLYILDSSLGRHGFYQVAVDLGTGELVALNNPQQLAGDDLVAALAFHLDELDASRAAAFFEAEARQALPSYAAYTQERLIAMREEKRKRFRVEPAYSRPNRVTVQEMDRRWAAGMAADMGY